MEMLYQDRTVVIVVVVIIAYLLCNLKKKEILPYKYPYYVTA